ncbi:hypothetical protein GCM10029963_77950 [Micromonospora andamanensis]|nr:hypothetical protein Vwe01_35450 [Micromonospora andamanensis]
MFERFTDGGRRVAVLAQEEARALNHNYMGTEHLLMGLVHEGEGVAATALEDLGVSLERVRQQVEEIIGRGHQVPEGHIPFTPRAKKVLELSLREALQLGHNYIGTEHILLGLIREGQGVGAQVLIKLGAELSLVRRQVISLLSGRPGGAPTPGSNESATPSVTVIVPTPPTDRVLDQFGRNLTRAAREGRLDPVVGRDKEVERVVQVLSRRAKNNPVLIGEPGVGKTAVVERLAQRIAKGEVLDTLRDKQLYALDLAALTAGSRSHGEMEERLRDVHLALRGTSGDTLLFVEDIELIFGTPRGDAATVWGTIRALLAGREIQLISTGSADTVRRIMRDDPRLISFLQEITVAPPSPRAAYDMLVALRDRYEAHHRVSITDAALSEAVRLADRYFHERRLPANAVDLIDEASAQVRIARMARPPDLLELDEHRAQVRREKEAMIDAQDFESAMQLRDKEKQLLERIAQREQEWQSGDNDVPEVDDDNVRLVVEQALRDRVDEESAAPTSSDLPSNSATANVFPDDDDVWAMS